MKSREGDSDSQTCVGEVKKGVLVVGLCNYGVGVGGIEVFVAVFRCSK